MTRTEMILLLMSDEQHGVREAIALTADAPDLNTTLDEFTRLTISNYSSRDPQSAVEEVILS